jgi:hypothetical protein
VRACARVVVWAALLSSAVLFASLAPNASAAPTAATSAAASETSPSTSADAPAHFFDLSDAFISDDSSASESTSPIAFRDIDSTGNSDPMAQSPAIALPPAVMSGLGLLCVLAACMAMRRFAYRPSSGSRRF